MVWLEVTMSHAAFRSDGGLIRTLYFIRRSAFMASVVGALLLLASCGSKQASGPHATVLMRDGSTLTGTVTATSPAEITLAGDVHIRCYARVLRVEPQDQRRGVAARIDRYEFLPASA